MFPCRRSAEAVNCSAMLGVLGIVISKGVKRNVDEALRAKKRAQRGKGGGGADGTNRCYDIAL